jgi:hypothetical protein
MSRPRFTCRKRDGSCTDTLPASFICHRRPHETNERGGSLCGSRGPWQNKFIAPWAVVRRAISAKLIKPLVTSLVWHGRDGRCWPVRTSA